jgi:hypothetical protein
VEVGVALSVGVLVSEGVAVRVGVADGGRVGVEVEVAAPFGATAPPPPCGVLVAVGVSVCVDVGADVGVDVS